MDLSTEEQAKAVVDLEQNDHAYDFWSEPSLVRDVDVMVPPHKFGDFEDFLARFNIEKRIKVENVQQLVDEQDPELTRPKNGETRNHGWTAYSTFAELNTWLDGRVAASQFLTNHVIGTSGQGRQLRVVSYSERTGNPAIFIEACTHAREWVAAATATWVINELISSTDPATRAMANTIDWYIVVVANPDGYVFSHESTRLWRKNRRTNTGSTCIGVDQNRNYDFFWMSGGASNNPCSDTFAGPSAFSEPETRAIRDYYGTIATRTRIFLSFHAFGQYLLMPYGHTSSQSNNHANLLSVANAAATAIRNTSGIDYLVGSTATVLYVASGSSPDWAFGVHNTRLAYTFEFRPIRGSNNGFLLPPAQIIPNCQEVMNGLKAMVAQARAVGQL